MIFIGEGAPSYCQIKILKRFELTRHSSRPKKLATCRHHHALHGEWSKTGNLAVTYPNTVNERQQESCQTKWIIWNCNLSLPSRHFPKYSGHSFSLCNIFNAKGLDKRLRKWKRPYFLIIQFCICSSWCIRRTRELLHW